MAQGKERNIFSKHTHYEQKYRQRQECLALSRLLVLIRADQLKQFLKVNGHFGKIPQIQRVYSS